MTDDEILGICSKFIESKRDLALENKLVVTITSSDEGYEVGFAPLTLNLPEVKKFKVSYLLNYLSDMDVI